MIALDYGWFRTISVWRRPDQNHHDIDVEIGQLFTQAAGSDIPSIVVGDFNETPHETHLGFCTQRC